MPNYRLLNNTGLAQDTQVIDVATRAPLQGVRAVHLDITPGNPVILQTELQSVVINVGSPSGIVVRMKHPVTGQQRTVMSITFAEGDTWSAG